MIELIDVGLEHPDGQRPLLRSAHLTVSPGEVVLIVGGAGVGTSRIAAATLGEVELVAGQIQVLGRDVAKLRRSSLRLLRRRVGVVPQDLCLLEDRSAQLNVMMPLEIDGIPRAISMARAAAVLSRLGLDAEAALPVGCLSPSVRQRVAVARALVREPAVVIADHPTSHQDAIGADRVCTALASAAHAGAACLVLGRDPALRAIAEMYGWRQLGLVGGLLRPRVELEINGSTMDDLLVGSEPGTMVPPPPGEPLPELDAEAAAELDNVVPFRRAEDRARLLGEHRKAGAR